MPDTLGMFRRQLKAECLKLWRIPDFSISTLLMPLIVFSIVGLPNIDRPLAGVSGGPYVLASFASYAVTAVMLYSFASVIAAERGLRTDVLVRIAPVPYAIVTVAKLVTGVLFCLLSMVSLFTFAWFVGGIHLQAAVLLTLVWRLLLGSLPFVALGFAIGYLAGPASVAAVLNVVYLPMAIASGMFLPLEQLPSLFQTVAPVLPTYRFTRLAWSAIGADPHSLGTDVFWLAVFTAAFVVLALAAYKLDERRRFT
jgi:ABC-2 type transport system permease protein